MSVTLRNLTKQYPSAAAPVVHGIDLEIRDGEFMVLVGPSGCGKSTTLRMIAGLEDITAGEITIGGRVVSHVAPKDRDIAMVFQNYALYPHMSVYENMAFGLKLRKFPKTEIDARVREAAAMLGLDAYLDRKPRALSGGQRQRVAVGRAIVRKPKVFLFDEPLSNLDAKMRVTMRAEIARLHARLGATMIYVTHDQTEAMTLGDRICVMKDGRIMQVAAPLEIYNLPANLFTAGFIGSPPMNFLTGTLTGAAGAAGAGLCFETAAATSDAAVTFRIPNPTFRIPPLPRPAVLGIRPEHIREAGAGETAHLAATVEIAEPLGAETYLHLQTPAGPLTARVAAATDSRPGRATALILDTTRAHLFDPGTGAALTP